MCVCQDAVQDQSCSSFCRVQRWTCSVEATILCVGRHVFPYAEDDRHVRIYVCSRISLLHSITDSPAPTAVATTATTTAAAPGAAIVIEVMLTQRVQRGWRENAQRKG